MFRAVLKSLVAAASLLPAASAALADQPAGPTPAFGNTLVSTYPDGRTARLWLHPDGGYVAEGRRHDRSNGRWSVKDDKLCLRQQSPFPVPFHYCTPMVHGDVGASWQAKAVTGEPITVRLVAGQG
jgi:hypothetical protein